MAQPGDDLRQYLIVPQPSSSQPSDSSTTTSNFEQSLETLSTNKGSLESKSRTENNQNAEMEIDTPTQLASLSSTHATHDVILTTEKPDDPLGKVLSLDEYVAAHQSTYEAEAAARAAAKQRQPRTTNSFTPTTTVPVAIGARSSKHTILLHEKYQALAISQPKFIYSGNQEQGWNAKIQFPGLEELIRGVIGEEEVKEKESFNSKPEAKEAASKRALEVLECLEREGKVSKPTKEMKRARAAAAVGNGGVSIPVEKQKKPGPNYIGQLLEFQRSTGSPQPTYTDYQLGTSFACLLTIEGNPQTFGSTSSLFPSKKAARQDAARTAVEHFKAEGLWPEQFTDVGGIKKKKASQPQLVQLPNTSNPGVDGPTASAATSTSQSPSTASYAQQVAQLASQLGLPTPEWRICPDNSSAPGFHTMHCIFKHGGPHEGPIGEVRHVLGKKKAKEECARLTLEYLMKEKERRMIYAQRMMEGAVNPREEVAEVATGKRVDGEQVPMMDGADDKDKIEDAVKI